MNLRHFVLLVVSASLAACRADYSDLSCCRFSTTVYADAPRTSFDGASGKVYWCRDDRLALLYGVDDEIDTSYSGAATSTVAGSVGVFEAVLNGTPAPSATDICRLFGLYPQEAFIGVEKNRLHCRLPSFQTASAASYDADAGLLFGISAAVEGAVPEDVFMSFRHIAAYGAVTIIPPSNISSTAVLEFVELVSERPLSGDFSFRSDGEDLSADEKAVGSVRAAFAENENSVRFACLPADLSGTTVTVALTTSAGKYAKTFIPARLTFDSGRTSRFTVDMSQCEPVPQAGDILWRDDFETAIPTAAANGKAGEVLGEYDPAAEGASCRLFADADRSELIYAGSYALYTEYVGAEDVRFEGRVFAHKGSADGYIAVENIPVYGVAKVELSFGTNAAVCSLETGYDGIYAEPVTVEVPSGERCTVGIELPRETGTLSFRLYGKSKLIRRFDNFELRVAEPAVRR